MISANISKFRNLGAPEAVQDAQQGEASEKEGIVQIRDDGNRRDAGHTGSHKKLGAIRDKSLHKAGKHIQQAGSPLRAYSETGRDILGY